MTYGSTETCRTPTCCTRTSSPAPRTKNLNIRNASSLQEFGFEIKGFGHNGVSFISCVLFRPSLVHCGAFATANSLPARLPGNEKQCLQGAAGRSPQRHRGYGSHGCQWWPRNDPPDQQSKKQWCKGTPRSGTKRQLGQ